MARWLDYVPEEIKTYIKLVRARRRYPGCRIGSYMIIPGAKLGMGCVIARDVEIGSRASIGDYSYINAGSIVASGSIGKFCSIGYYVQIGLPSHPVDFISTSPQTYGSENVFGAPMYWNDYQAPPVIENDVWIGSSAIIMQGVHISNGAVIAAGAIVTHDVPPYAIVAGIPARIKRQRFDDAVIEQLLAWRWWDLSIEELRRSRDVFERGNLGVRSLIEADR